MKKFLKYLAVPAVAALTSMSVQASTRVIGAPDENDGDSSATVPAPGSVPVVVALTNSVADSAEDDTLAAGDLTNSASEDPSSSTQALTLSVDSDDEEDDSDSDAGTVVNSGDGGDENGNDSDDSSASSSSDESDSDDDTVVNSGDGGDENGGGADGSPAPTSTGGGAVNADDSDSSSDSDSDDESDGPQIPAGGLFADTDPTATSGGTDTSAKSSTAVVPYDPTVLVPLTTAYGNTDNKGEGDSGDESDTPLIPTDFFGDSDDESRDDSSVLAPATVTVSTSTGGGSVDADDSGDEKDHETDKKEDGEPDGFNWDEDEENVGF